MSNNDENSSPESSNDELRRGNGSKLDSGGDLVSPDSKSNIAEKEHDVFLSYNSDDRKSVEAIAERLRGREIKPWLDGWELIPGDSWQKELDKQIRITKTAAVFFGINGLGTWHEDEMYAFQRENKNRGLRVIPVMLESYPEKIELPSLMDQFLHIDFRKENPDPFEELIRGITGSREMPEDEAPEHSYRESGPDPELKVLVKEEIVKLLGLQKSRLICSSLFMVLKEKAGNHMLQSPESMADTIMGMELNNGVTCLDKATRKTIALMKSESKSTASLIETWEVARDLLGWMVLLAVDGSWISKPLTESGLNRATGIFLPVKNATGAVIAFSGLKKTKAQLVRNDTYVTGENNIPITGWVPEVGWDGDETVNEVKRNIHSCVFQTQDPPVFFTKDHNDFLNEYLKTRNEIEEYHYIIVDRAVRDNPLHNHEIYRKLVRDVPVLKDIVLFLGIDGDVGALRVCEVKLSARILSFLTGKPE